MAALLVLALAGCEKAAEPTAPAPAASAAVTTPTTTPTTKATKAATEAAPVLEDGRHPVYLTKVDGAGKKVTFDLIEFLTGEEAKARWKKENPEHPDGPDNDYMIVNENPKLRTLPVAADADCQVLASLGGVDMTQVKFTELPAVLKEQSEVVKPTPPRIAVLPFWLTVEDGTVVGLEEQFLP
ncbi:hypothetical protein [Actinoplanes sp. NPDC049802]|uniref:hypothetical protein n=1 Tax=Actinoplanes sp. NPDC049802 TaxID=3154742 RepID=UPI0033C62086